MSLINKLTNRKKSTMTTSNGGSVILYVANSVPFHPRTARQNSFRTSFQVVQTSGQVYLKQNLTRKLILRSVWPQLVQNHAKSTKTKFSGPKFSSKKIFRRRKIKRRESSETRFGKVSRRSEPYSRRKCPFEVSETSADNITELVTVD